MYGRVRSGQLKDDHLWKHAQNWEVSPVLSISPKGLRKYIDNFVTFLSIDYKYTKVDIIIG